MNTVDTAATTAILDRRKVKAAALLVGKAETPARGTPGETAHSEQPRSNCIRSHSSGRYIGLCPHKLSIKGVLYHQKSRRFIASAVISEVDATGTAPEGRRERRPTLEFCRWMRGMPAHFR